MPTGLKRYHQTGNFHFITFSCYRAGGPQPTTKARVPHPSRFCEGWDVNCSHSHASGPQALPPNRKLPLHHLQLLPGGWPSTNHKKLGCPSFALLRRVGCKLLAQPCQRALKRYHQTENFHFITFSCYRRPGLPPTDTTKGHHPTNPRTDSQTIAPLYRGLRPHARAHPPPNRRTHNRHSGLLPANLQTAHLPRTQIRRPETILATPFTTTSTSTPTRNESKKSNTSTATLSPEASSPNPKTIAGAASTTTPPANPAPSRSSPNGPLAAAKMQSGRVAHI